MSTPTTGTAAGAIHAHSLVTLNFRVTHPATSQTLITTFGATPATMQLGAGELMPSLESRLIGLAPGTRKIFHFAPGEAFGDYNEALVERVQRKHIPPSLYLEQDTVYSFPAPDGSTYPGLVRELTETEALIDFNHPMAGKAVDVEVEIIGVI
ncbi:peptidylprolyl isomerase [Uliginosibacterium sp. H3]|uniref:peptidylprolyl isomerase n=1 Tax=Uliginosibacterium silvisoli TaxID=3114758 RepID=A0ABU6K8K8_9RHOO|nr:peptidylprolyl isomerase [Uliginosibacterium sp. H3]